MPCQSKSIWSLVRGYTMFIISEKRVADSCVLVVCARTSALEGFSFFERPKTPWCTYCSASMAGSFIVYRLYALPIKVNLVLGAWLHNVHHLGETGGRLLCPSGLRTHISPLGLLFFERSKTPWCTYCSASMAGSFIVYRLYALPIKVNLVLGAWLHNVHHLGEKGGRLLCPSGLRTHISPLGLHFFERPKTPWCTYCSASMAGSFIVYRLVCLANQSQSGPWCVATQCSSSRRKGWQTLVSWWFAHAHQPFRASLF